MFFNCISNIFLMLKMQWNINGVNEHYVNDVHVFINMGSNIKWCVNINWIYVLSCETFLYKDSDFIKCLNSIH